MKKVKPATFQAQANQEQLAPSEIAKEKLEAEEILQLKTRILDSSAHTKKLETVVTTLLELRVALEKLDSDTQEPIALIDIDEQVKLFKRQIHFYQSSIRRNQDRIQTIITKDIIRSERYKQNMPELKSRKRYISRKIQETELVINTLKATAEGITDVEKLFEPIIKPEHIQQRIQLGGQEKLKYESQLQCIEAKIMDLEQEVNQDTCLVANHAKQTFFNGKPEKDNSPQPELKLHTLNY